MIEVRKLKGKTVYLFQEVQALVRQRFGGFGVHGEFKLSAEQWGVVEHETRRRRKKMMADSSLPVASGRHQQKVAKLHAKLQTLEINIHFDDLQKSQISGILAACQKARTFDQRFNEFKPKKIGMTVSTGVMVAMDVFGLGLAFFDEFFLVEILASMMWTFAVATAAITAGIAVGAIMHYKGKRQKDNATNALIHQFIRNEYLIQKQKSEEEIFGPALSLVLEHLAQLHLAKYGDDSLKSAVFIQQQNYVIDGADEQERFARCVAHITECNQKNIIPDAQYRALKAILTPASEQTDTVEVEPPKPTLYERVKRVMSPKLQASAGYLLTFFGVGVGVFTTYQGIADGLIAANVIAGTLAGGAILAGVLAVGVGAMLAYWVYQNNREISHMKDYTRERDLENFQLSDQLNEINGYNTKLSRSANLLSDYVNGLDVPKNRFTSPTPVKLAQPELETTAESSSDDSPSPLRRSS